MNELKSPDFKKHVLFMNGEGQSMHFIVLISDTEERKSTIASIKKHCGTVHDDLKEFGPHSIVLIKPQSSTGAFQSHDKECFDFVYIEECIEAGYVLDINKYVSHRTKNYDKNLDFMEVVYEKLYKWDELPRTSPHKSDSESDHSDSDISIENVPCRRSLAYRDQKHLRKEYVESERKDIIQYIVKNNSYLKIKGTLLWKEMEAKEVCTRTWQSMKEHFLKQILPGICTSSNFSYLSNEIRMKFRKALFLKRKK